jgi:hypothetical protein
MAATCSGAPARVVAGMARSYADAHRWMRAET